MAIFTQNFFETRIELDHDEVDKLIEALKGGIPAVTGLLSACGVPVFAVGIIGAALVLHAAWEIAVMKIADKGDGVILTSNLFLLPSAIFIPNTRYVEHLQGWSSQQDFTISNIWGDRIQSNIVMGDNPANVIFRLENHCYGRQIRTGFMLRDGSGNEWFRIADPGKPIAEDSLWSGQVKNGQLLTFYSSGFGMFDQWSNRLSIGELENLQPGSIVTFTWTEG